MSSETSATLRTFLLYVATTLIGCAFGFTISELVASSVSTVFGAVCGTTYETVFSSFSATTFVSSCFADTDSLFSLIASDVTFMASAFVSCFSWPQLHPVNNAAVTAIPDNNLIFMVIYLVLIYFLILKKDLY